MNGSRQSAIAQAKAEIARQPVYLDTETTGTDNFDQIVEICVLDHDGRVLVESLVRPTTAISPSAGGVHGITIERLTDAPTWVEVWPVVQNVLNGRRTAIYNADFDRRLMRQSHHAHGLHWQMDGSFVFCIMELYAQFYGQWNPRRGSYRWQSLEAAGQQCGLSLRNAHRAKDDALLARAVLHYVAQQK